MIEAVDVDPLKSWRQGASIIGFKANEQLLRQADEKSINMNRSAYSWTYPPSVGLAISPTPVHPLVKLSDEFKTTLLCKRDDLTGVELSGNKVRKLEYLIADALAKGSDGVITCGGEQSNHARATAIAAARMGLRCHLILFTDDPDHPPGLIGNVLLDKLVGASVRWTSNDQYALRQILIEEEAERLTSETGAPYYCIPEGGSDSVGAWGYVRCLEELRTQLGPEPATIVYPMGSGGTAAGLYLGRELLGVPYNFIGISVAEDVGGCRNRITTILDDLSERYQIDLDVPSDEIEIWDNYVGRGYALSRNEELEQLVAVAQGDGVIFDPVYTGKMLFGLCSELRSSRAIGSRVVLLHTGGLFGLFAKAEQLTPLL